VTGQLVGNERKSTGRKSVDKGEEVAHPHNSLASYGELLGGKTKNHVDHKVETKLHGKRYGK
jgi:hypothetical protein